MTDVASSRKFVQSESVDFKSPVSESALTTISGSVNYLIDERDAHETSINTNTTNIATNTSNIAGIGLTFSESSTGSIGYSSTPALVLTATADKVTIVHKVVISSSDSSSNPILGLRNGTSSTANEAGEIALASDGTYNKTSVILLGGDTLYIVVPSGGTGNAVVTYTEVDAS